jgi:hypothetical protein
MKSIFFLLLTLSALSSNGFASENPRCDKFSKNIDLAFPHKDGEHITLKSKNDYMKMKSELEKIEIDQAQIDQYLTELNDEKPMVSDITNWGKIFSATCIFAEVKATNSLLKYVRQHSELKKDFIFMMKTRIQKYKNTPSLIMILIQDANAIALAGLEFDENSPLIKDLQALRAKIRDDNKRLFDSQSKAEKKDKDYSEKEIKNYIALLKEEVDLSRKYFPEFEALLLKL